MYYFKIDNRILSYRKQTMFDPIWQCRAKTCPSGDSVICLEAPCPQFENASRSCHPWRPGRMGGSLPRSDEVGQMAWKSGGNGSGGGFDRLGGGLFNPPRPRNLNL